MSGCMRQLKRLATNFFGALHSDHVWSSAQPTFNGMYTVILKASPRCGAVRSQGDFLQEI